MAIYSWAGDSPADIPALGLSDVQPGQRVELLVKDAESLVRQGLLVRRDKPKPKPADETTEES